ncbi:alpha/beta fold hydrolase [Streptomyces spectabilis]|uniref:thioesterase II family protein n=1 Tax=Streptomyces spectabilis TaxID=68270 RepID=UPI003409798F
MPPYGLRSDPRVAVLDHCPQAPLRLYCFPPAGQGAEFYVPWRELLAPVAELCSFHLPGRGRFADAPSHTDAHLLAGRLAAAVRAQDDERPVALFGHSAGALLAYETGQALHRGGRPPLLLAASAMSAPHSGTARRTFGQLIAQGQASVSSLLPLLPGHSPHAANPDPGAFAAAWTPLLADILLVLQHRFRDEPAPPYDLVVYGGDRDSVAPPHELAAWCDLVPLAPPPVLFPGGHMYLLEQPDAFCARLRDDLRCAAHRVPTERRHESAPGPSEARRPSDCR